MENPDPGAGSHCLTAGDAFPSGILRSLLQWGGTER